MTNDAKPLWRKPKRSWRAKFADASRGVYLGVRGHSSFAVHLFAAVLVVFTALVLRCGLLEWCVLVGCIGAVMTAELFNSALETLFHGLDDATKNRLVGVLDIGAGAVLMASMTSV